MKMKPEHYEQLKAQLLPLVPSFPALLATLQQNPKIKDVRLALAWAAVSGPRLNWVCSTLYPYLNDSHIDTALRRILAEIFP